METHCTQCTACVRLWLLQCSPAGGVRLGSCMMVHSTQQPARCSSPTNSLTCLFLLHAVWRLTCRLYESWGFQATPWVDPTWQEDAEKGRAVRQRRVMMLKPLSGPGMSSKHLRSVS